MNWSYRNRRAGANGDGASGQDDGEPKGRPLGVGRDARPVSQEAVGQFFRSQSTLRRAAYCSTRSLSVISRLSMFIRGTTFTEVGAAALPFFHRARVAVYASVNRAYT